MASGPSPATCPIGWQPHALAPVFYGARSLALGDTTVPSGGAGTSGVVGSPPPVPLRIYFPSLDGAVETAPILEGCGRYPVLLFAHGQCSRDKDHYRRWFQIPGQLARAGYVVVVPHLAGNFTGTNPSVPAHPDEATLAAVLAWVRNDWVHANLVMPPPATGVLGHSFGAMLGARFAVGRPVSAYAGLSGRWLDWFGDEPFPLPLLDVPTLLAWGSASDQHTALPEDTWQAMARPRHRVVFTKGEHWDYLRSDVRIPCRGTPGPCPHVAGAVGDLLTMFFGRYLPPEFAGDLPDAIPPTLAPPPLDLTVEQEFYAGGYLGGYEALDGDEWCDVTVSEAVESLVANTRSKETHSRDHPCAWVSRIAARHRRVVSARPTGYRWCDFCFRSRADG